MATAAGLCSRAEFARQWRNRSPLLFTEGLTSCEDAWGGFAKGWELSENSDGALMGAVPECTEVSCFKAPLDGRTFLKRGGICREERLRWREAVLAGTNNGPASARAYTRASLSDLAPELLGRVQLSSVEEMVGSTMDPHLCGLWISSPGCVTPLHFDMCHGLLCQVRGEKRVLLADPLATRSLYLNDPGHPNPQSSRVDLLAWLEGESHGQERKRYPRVGSVDWFEVVLRPGQALYIPPLWWHHVETLGGASSVSVLLPFDPDTGEVQHPCGQIV